MARRYRIDSRQETGEMGKMRGLNLRSRLVDGVLLLLEFTYHLEPVQGGRLWEAHHRDGVAVHRVEQMGPDDLQPRKYSSGCPIERHSYKGNATYNSAERQLGRLAGSVRCLWINIWSDNHCEHLATLDPPKCVMHSSKGSTDYKQPLISRGRLCPTTGCLCVVQLAGMAAWLLPGCATCLRTKVVDCSP